MTKMYNFGTCAVEDKNKIIICEENNKKFILNNKTRQTIIKVYVDNPKDKNINCNGLDFYGQRCDCLIIEKRDNIANFIELKGQNVNNAVKQLSNSIKIISNPANNFIDERFKLINSFIVTSKVPKHININKDKDMFMKKYNSKLTVKNNTIEIIV